MRYTILTLGQYQQAAANQWEDTGLTITVPTGHVFLGELSSGWSSGKPIGLGVNQATSLTGGQPNFCIENENAVLAIDTFLYPGTWHVFTKRASAGTTNNNYYYRYIDILTE